MAQNNSSAVIPTHSLSRHVASMTKRRTASNRSDLTRGRSAGIHSPKLQRPAPSQSGRLRSKLPTWSLEPLPVGPLPKGSASVSGSVSLLSLFVCLLLIACSSFSIWPQKTVSSSPSNACKVPIYAARNQGRGSLANVKHSLDFPTLVAGPF